MGCGFAGIVLAAIGAYAIYSLGFLSLPLAWIAGISTSTFLVFKYDKIRSPGAQSGAERIPERALLLLTLIGGTPGTLLGMYLPPRHKTRKGSFKMKLLVVLVIQAIALYFLWPRIQF